MSFSRVTSLHFIHRGVFKTESGKASICHCFLLCPSHGLRGVLLSCPISSDSRVVGKLRSHRAQRQTLRRAFLRTSTQRAGWDNIRAPHARLLNFLVSLLELSKTHCVASLLVVPLHTSLPLPRLRATQIAALPCHAKFCTSSERHAFAEVERKRTACLSSSVRLRTLEH